MLDADETPDSSAGKHLKRPSRRETADFMALQDLLSTPDATTRPMASNSGDVDTKGAEPYSSGVEPVGKGSSGVHASSRSPALGGGDGKSGSGAALAREGFHNVDERRDSGETASTPELLGLFKRGTEGISWKNY